MRYSSFWFRRWLLALSSFILIIFGGCGELTGPQTNNKAEAFEVEDLTINDVGGDCEMSTVSAFVENASDSTRYTVSHDSSNFAKSGIVPESGEIVVNVGDKDGKFKFEVSDNAGGQQRQAQASATLDCDQQPVGPGSVAIDSTWCDNSNNPRVRVGATNGYDRWKKTNTDTGVVEDSSGFNPEEDFFYTFTDLVSGDDYEFTLFRGENGGTVQSSPLCPADPIPPNADFSFETDELTVDFDGTLSSDEDGTIESYEWEFGDGSTGSGETPTHVYPETGYYDVKLTVIDDDGLSDSITKEVYVEKIVSCPCFVDILQGDRLVWGKSKGDFVELTDRKELLTGPNEAEYVRVQIWWRYSQGDQQNEDAALGFVNPEGDTLWTDIVEDKDDSGSGEEWRLVTFELPADFLEPDTEYKIVMAHGHYFFPIEYFGVDSVWARDDPGKSAYQTQADGKAAKAIERENNAPSTVLMPKSGGPGFQPNDHLIKVEVEVKDKYCPDNRQ